MLLHFQLTLKELGLRALFLPGKSCSEEFEGYRWMLVITSAIKI